MSMPVSGLGIVLLSYIKSPAKGKLVIQKMINGEKCDLESSGLSKREWNELMVSLKLDKSYLVMLMCYLTY